MQDLIDTWKNGKKAVTTDSAAEELIIQAKEKRRNVRNAHLGTVFILTITLAGLALFFYYKAPFGTLLSHLGMGMMLGGLMLRIGIEIVSIVKSNAIQVSGNTEEATKAAYLFYRFRKGIHGPITVAIVGIYALGFYFLTPEFSHYIAFHWMILMHLSFLLGGVFLIWVIRKGIKKELTDLVHLTKIRNEITVDGENQAG